MPKKNQPGCRCCGSAVTCCPSLIRGTPKVWRLEIDGQTFDYKRYLPLDTDEPASWTVDGRASCLWYNDEGETPAQPLEITVYGDGIYLNNLQIYTDFDDGCDPLINRSRAVMSFTTDASSGADGPTYEAQRLTPFDGTQVLTLYLGNAIDFPDWPSSIDLEPIEYVPCPDDFPCTYSGGDFSECGVCCEEFQTAYVHIGSDTGAGSFTNGDKCSNCSSLNTLSVIAEFVGQATSTTALHSIYPRSGESEKLSFWMWTVRWIIARLVRHGCRNDCWNERTIGTVPGTIQRLF